MEEPSKKLRGKTDKSLDKERIKTDQHLNKKRQKVEDETSEEIRLNRLAADEVRESQREDVDDKSVLRERTRSDEAQDIERKEEDHARAKERFQKRLIAESLLAYERKKTNINLLEERFRLDMESKKNSSLLADEKDSHEQTKAAVVTRDQFLAIVSHDLRNLLTAISIGAGLLQKSLVAEVIDKVFLQQYVKIIETSAANMDRMISDLLDVERMANNKLVVQLEDTDLCALLLDCKELFSPAILNKSFSMSITGCKEPIYARVDYDRILQVLANLIGNAIKFTPNGGSLNLSIAKQDGKVKISVADNGPGIEEKTKLLIFERFSQLKIDDRRGLGLGLYISKWIVEAHNGEIWVDSEVGKGSVFSFTL